MLRPPAGNHEHGVDSHVIALPHEARGEALRRHRDTPQSPLVESEGSSVLACSRLDLDERERSAAPRDDVDLSTFLPSRAGQEFATL